MQDLAEMMSRRLTLSLILAVFALIVGKFSAANLITNNGGSTPYTLANGDTLFIASGTYTGDINGIASGATIIVSNLADFQPASLPNNTVGTIYVYGTFKYTSSLTTNTNFKLHNYGMVTLASLTVKGKDQVWTNFYGGIINFTGDVLMNGTLVEDDNNVLINYETINCTANFQMNSGARFTNYKDFLQTGNFRVNGGTLRNEGNLVVTGNILMNNGASVITNYCRMEATGGITNTSGNFLNYSYVWARNSDINNSATIINVNIPGAPPPMIHGRNYTHSGSGTMTGPALLYFYGTTTMTGGTIGVSGLTADTIKMNDITRTSPAQIFDVQSGGTRYPNVIYKAWGVPDSLRNYLFGCSVEIFLQIPLAINWNYFYVNLSDNVPVLNWSADHDAGTVFEIQRSYDGTFFGAINSITSVNGVSEYNYKDRQVNTQSPVAYYRIKAVGPGGAEKYTQIKTVRFRNNQGVSVYAAPNPFTSNFIIDYTTTGREKITIRMFNVSGQQTLAKTVTVNTGNNIINITEAARLANGVYMIQVSNEHAVISSGKIVKN